MADIDWEKGAIAPPSGTSNVDWDAGEIKPPPQKRSAFAVANDTVIETANAAAGGLSSAANFFRPGNAASGWIDKNIIQAGDQAQSDVTKAAKQKYQQEVESASGAGEELAAVGRHIAGSPVLSLAQAAGSFAGPGLAIRGARGFGAAAGLAEKGIARAGLAGGSAVSGAMAGGDAASTAYDLSKNAGASEADATAAAHQASGFPAVIGALGGLVGAERLVAGAKGFAGNALSRALKTGVVEGAQEAFEEGVTQYEGQRAAMPFDPSIDPTKGVAAAAGMGAALGAATGGGAALLTGGHGQKPAPQQEVPVPDGWTTSPGVDQAPGPSVPPPEAPGFTTSPGAAPERTGGMDYQRDISTDGLSLVDAAAQDRAQAATIDFDQADTTPGWDTSPGAAPPRVDGIDMGREFDTSGLELDNRLPSERMGIDPNAGPLSRAATIAVDSTPIQEAQLIGRTDRDLQAYQPKPGIENDNVIDVQGRVVEDRAISTPRRIGQDGPVNRILAGKMARDAGPGHEVVAVDGGFAVQKAASNQPQLPAPLPQSAINNGAANVQNAAPAAGTQAQAAPTQAPEAARGNAPTQAAPVPAARAGAVEADGVAGEKINKSWTAFAPESGTLAVPRAEMPQIKAEHRGAMVNFLKARGIESQQAEVAADSLKPTQAEFSPGKVAKAKGFTGGDRSILVSSDGHVLDGHHQWMAKRESGEPVKVIRLDAPIRELMAAVKEFPSAAQSAGANPQSPQSTPKEIPNGITPNQAQQAAPQRQEAPAQPDPAVVARHPTWRKNAIQAGRVAKSLGIDPKGKRLAQMVAEIDAADSGRNQATAHARTAQPATENVAPAPGSTPPSAKSYLAQVDEARKQSEETAKIAPKEIIEPGKDVLVGTNSAGEKLHERKDGTRYAMRNGRPNFGGDLVAAYPNSQDPLRPAKTREADAWSDNRREEPGSARIGRDQRPLADAERGEFTLTGSDLAADVGAAGGQRGMFDEAAAPASDGFGEKFTLTLNDLFQNVPYRASAPVPLATGESVVSTEIVPRKTVISKADQEAYDLPATVLAWRVSAIKHANGEFSARIEPMVKDYGRAPGGEVVAYFQDARGVADAIDRIAPSVSKIAIQAYEKASGAAGGQQDLLAEPAPADKPTTAAVKIQDFGEKIGGAKKDTWSGFKDDLSAVKDDDIAARKLSEIWPAPDYQKLIDAGMDAKSVAIIRALRDEIPAKPRNAYKIKRWADQVQTMRMLATNILEGKDTGASVADFLNRGAGSLRGIAGRADLYEAVGHDKSLEGIRLAHHHYSLYRGRENVSLWVAERDAGATAFSNWPQELATGDTKEDAIAAFKARYAELDSVAAVKKASYDVFSKSGESAFFVGKKIGRNVAELAGPFTSLKEARDYRANNLAELDAKLAKYKEIPRDRRDTNEPRVGEDMRNGQDVTPEMFADVFGFKGVEFGNWVGQKRRQKDLNDAFDALMDMAAVMGVPAKAISLNGELGLAFGARGSGGVNPAAAHYEADKIVINLTKVEGAGSLGHEWWHALDNYFSRMRANKTSTFMTTATDVGLSARSSAYVAYPGVRKEMIDAFGEVVRSIRLTAMKARSSKMDAKRTKEYWTTGEEMAARAFESYLISKLQDQNASNDYLANVVDQKTWDAMAALGMENEDSYPYPTAGEIPVIRAGFDKFFQVLETKETEQGVAMFSRSGEDAKSSVLSKNGKFKGWPRYNAWTRAEYNDVVSLLPADYRNDPHRREPLSPADRDARAAAALPQLDQLNAGLPKRTFTVDQLGNIAVDARNVGVLELQAAAEIADQHGLGIYVTGVQSGQIKLLQDAGFVSEAGLGAVLQRAARTNSAPMPTPLTTMGAPAYGTIMSYKPRGFSQVMFSFGGPKAATADFNVFSAMERIKAGDNAETVRRETGWHQGADKKWRFEIDDMIAHMKGTGGIADLLQNRAAALGKPVSEMTVGDIMYHPALFAAYPALANVPVGTKAGRGATLATAMVNGQPDGMQISMGRDIAPGNLTSIMLHELQHGIQRIEGFASGGSPNNFANTAQDRKMLEDGAILARMMNQGGIEEAKQLFARRLNRQPAPGAESAALSGESPASMQKRAAEMQDPVDRYRRLAGEVEARNTQTRQNLTATQRKLTPPGKTADVNPADVIVVFNGQVMDSAPPPANATRTPARKASDANLVATQQLVDGLREKWTNAPEIIVARNMQDAQIPQPVRDYDQTLKSQGATGEARGFIYQGKVYLLADQLNGPHQIAEVLFHEVLGHYGLRRAFGKGLTPILQQVATMRRKEMQAKAKEYGLDLTNERDRLTAAEEILAEMAQTTPEIGFVKRAIAVIRNWMRANVPGFQSLRLTDNDIIQKFLLPARGAVTRSKETGLQSIERAMASFSRAPATDTPAFKKWFGENGVADSDGNPRIFIHSGMPGLNIIHNQGRFGGIFVLPEGQNARYGDETYKLALRGKIASTDDLREFANNSPEEVAAVLGEKVGSDAYESALEIVLDQSVTDDNAELVGGIDAADGFAEMQKLRGRIARAAGATAVEMEDEFGGDALLVVDGRQVKDVERNNGDFDPANPDIRFSRATGTSAWDAPEPSRFDALAYKMQDKHIDTKRVVESITKTVGQVKDSLNVYLQEELYHGRAARRVADFGGSELKPLLNQMRMAGLSLDDVEEYLHARHAKEANALIASREPGMPDGGSGMTNKAADDYMRNLPADQKRKLEAVAAKVDAITASTRQLYADYGLEDQKTVDGWGTMFANYVPLMREGKDGGMGIGQGFTVKGKEVKGRTGSTRKVVDILANIAAQREKVIVRGEKNRVATALVGLAAANPNPEFWEARSQPPTERVYDAKTDSVIDRPDSMFKQRANVVTAKVKDAKGNVTEQAVVFNEDDPRAMRMAAALKNLDAANLEGLLGVSAKITRYFSAMNTQYNPVFGVVNLVRDVQGAMVNLAATPLAGQQGKIAKDTLSALASIYQDVRAERSGKQATSKWSKLWAQMQEDGGTTGYRDLFATTADRANSLKSIINPEAWADSPWGKVFTANGTLKVPLTIAKQKAGVLFDWLSDYNDAMENGVRLAVYKAALDKGMSREQAASMAKNLTVNFNRKGQIGQQAGALYAFFNAAMQGTARIGQTLFDMDGGNVKTIRLSKTGKAVVYGGVTLGAVQALMLAGAGFDDEDPPEFVRERSLIIPTGGKTYVSIPMPLGLHVIPGIGRHATEFALSGFEKPAKRVVSMLGMLADAFNPIGNSGLSIQTIAPTVIDPLVALTENRDWTGKPIARVSSNKAIPGHSQWKDTATSMSKVIAEAVNWISGGDEYVAGAFSPTPDQIDYLIAQVTGGVGREISKVEQAGKAALSGEELPTYKTPLLGRFYGNAEGQASEGAAFYANVDKLNEIETKVKAMRKDGKMAEASEYLRSKPEAVLIFQVNAAERRIQQLKRDKRELIEQDASREQVRAKEVQITEVMARLNRAAEARSL